MEERKIDTDEQVLQDIKDTLSDPKLLYLLKKLNQFQRFELKMYEHIDSVECNGMIDYYDIEIMKKRKKHW